MKKIPTIFHRPARTPWLVEPLWHPDALWVLDGHGVATLKLDGTACCVAGARLYRRREVRPGDATPAGFLQVDAAQCDGGEKRIGWVPVDRAARGDRAPVAAWDAYHADNGYCAPDGTYELVGPKVQGNPYGLPAPMLVSHASPRLRVLAPDTPPRTFEGLRAWLAAYAVEGLVWHHESGAMAKIKRRDFGWPWPAPGAAIYTPRLVAVPA